MRDAVTAFEPDANRVLTRDGRTLTYDWLIVAPGIQVNWSTPLVRMRAKFVMKLLR